MNTINCIIAYLESYPSARVIVMAIGDKDVVFEGREDGGHKVKIGKGKFYEGCFLYLQTLTKEDHILHWKTTASKDWKRVNLLYKNRDYIFALFCAT